MDMQHGGKGDGGRDSDSRECSTLLADGPAEGPAEGWQKVLGVQVDQGLV